MSWLHAGRNTRCLGCICSLVPFSFRFAVTPLTEDAGLIEWVNGVEPLRHIVRRTQPGGPSADRQTGPKYKAMYDRWPKVRPLSSKGGLLGLDGLHCSTTKAQIAIGGKGLLFLKLSAAHAACSLDGFTLAELTRHA